MCERKILYVMLIISLFPIALWAGAAATGQIIYVDDDAAGANNGSSWADAYNHLQDALADADASPKPVEIRVAQGIYKPDQGRNQTPGDRGATFQLINGVAIYGGCAGFGEPDPDARDASVYKSVLSGDLNGDDVEVEEPRRLLNEPTRRDNGCHVVTGSHTDQTAVLDGFIITAGLLAVVRDDDPRGGAGMRIESGSPTLIDCLFTGNSAISGAAALLNFNGSEPTLMSCTFSGNDSIHGAMENKKSSPVLSDCKFTRNSFAGMLNDDGSSPILVNCSFENNGREGMVNRYESNPNLTGCTFRNNAGTGMENSGSSPILIDCAFDKNERGGMRNFGPNHLTLNGCTFTGHSNRAIDHSGGSLTLRDCLFSDNTGFSGAAIDSFGDVILYDCAFRRNSARATGGGIAASGSGNLTLQGCTFSGNSAGEGGAIFISGNILLRNCTFDGNAASRRGGAIMTWGNLARVNNCTFSGNRSGGEGSCIRKIRAAGILSLTHCIVWDNGPDQINGSADVSYSNIQGGFPGPGNIDIDPLFARPGNWDPNGTPTDTGDDFWVDGDYHLLSQAGRWDPHGQAWVQDDVTSPCIDAGDPNSPIGTEPFPNGGRINMGAYGGADKASKSYFGRPVCGAILAGDINGDCVVDFEDLAIVVSHWMMRGEDFVNKPPTVRLTEPQDGAQITWPGPTIFRAEADDADGEILVVNFVLQQKTNGGSHTIGLTDRDGTDGWQQEHTWGNNADPGTWTVRAEATDNQGAKAVSPEITITLYRP
jgi:predicted outer membrane repeat protein